MKENVTNTFTEEEWKEYRDALLFWFDRNRRILPWREDPTPYHVWVSEIMLQQTRVEAVKPYYDRFLAELPDVQALADAPEQQLLKLWEGLGYYNRVRNMQLAAQQIVTDYYGEIPQKYEVLLELKGIGSYTAGAISSIAYGNAVPAVDGNVLRVLARNLEYDGDILKDSTKKYFFSLLKEHMPKDRAGDFNQALMELGATVCIPNGKPLCEDCPIYGTCLARKHDTTSKYPVKATKKQRKIVDKTIFRIFNENGELLLHKRADEGLLAGLWELPNIDEKYIVGEPGNEMIRRIFAQDVISQQTGTDKHIFSHIEWHMTCITLRGLTWDSKVYERLQQCFGSNLIFASLNEIEKKYPLPAAFSMWI
ncbi:MAG: A/G-specific adenine glycosylase [Lachnospiraceae bacterium]|nr:A/G-specific adenine glycosylase [Lachnospiraceae bacterium]